MAKARRKIASKTRRRRKALDIPEGARPASLPAEFKPQLATLVDRVPAEPADWLFEIKFDGYRMLARVDTGGVRLITRNGHDWTHKLPHLASALARMKLAPCWLDGEIVVSIAKGGTSFQQLQNAFDSERTEDIVYFVFDIPYHAGHDLRAVPLETRRRLLETVLAEPPAPIRFSATFDAEPDELVSSACRLGLEGIIGKRRDSHYASRRSPDWIKLKCSQRQEFVIGGWTDPQGSRVGFGALLLGVHDDQGRLLYAGKIGTGFDTKTLTSLLARFRKLAAAKSPFSGPVEGGRRAHWIKPSLLAEVSFTEWTQDGHIRHGVFHALRTDKPAKAIVREKPQGPA